MLYCGNPGRHPILSLLFDTSYSSSTSVFFIFTLRILHLAHVTLVDSYGSDYIQSRTLSNSYNAYGTTELVLGWFVPYYLCVANLTKGMCLARVYNHNFPKHITDGI